MGEAKKRGMFSERQRVALNRLQRARLSRRQGSLIQSLDEGRARYLVIGGMAVQLHGVDRKTIDLDIWTAPTRENAAIVARALCSIAGESALRFEDRLSHPNVRIALPTPSDAEIDVLTSVGNLDFDDMYARSVVIAGDTPLRTLSILDLIESKRVGMEATQRQIETGELQGLALAQAQIVFKRDQSDIDQLAARVR